MQRILVLIKELWGRFFPGLFASQPPPELPEAGQAAPSRSDFPSDDPRWGNGPPMVGVL